MRNKYKPLFGDILVAVVVGGGIILVFWFLYFSRSGIIKSEDVFNDSYEITGPPLKFELLDDSVRILESNLNQMKRKAESSRTNLIHGSGMQMGGVGVYNYTDSTMQNSQKFIVLADFGLNQNSFDYENGSSYYYSDGKSYLRIPVLKKIKNHQYKLFYKDKLVKYRYDYKSNQILIPLLSNIQLVIVNIVCYFIVGIMLFIRVFGSLLLLKFLVGISRNKIFEEINIRRLFWVSMCCFIIVAIPHFLSFLIYLFYFKTLSDGVIYTKTFSSNDFYFTLVGVLFLAIYIAFKKGYNLKKENDLTI